MQGNEKDAHDDARSTTPRHLHVLRAQVGAARIEKWLKDSKNYESIFL